MGAWLPQAEIISVDKNYSADKSVMDPDYKPKVRNNWYNSCCGHSLSTLHQGPAP